MRFTKNILFMLSIMFTSLGFSQTEKHTYKVTFYNIVSQNNGLPVAACEEMLKTFKFSVSGDQYDFNQNDNPSFSHHKAIAFLTLKKTQFLEVDNIETKFNYQNKNYSFTSNLFSITYTNPFILKGIIVNSYCKAAYIVLLDDPQQLELTNVKSVSPTR